MIIAAPILPSLTSALQILSAMITPAVLIMACGSLVMTTSTRLIRCVDRVRSFTAEIDTLDSAGSDDRARYEMLLYQLERTADRARLLQRALSRLYIGIGTFVATSVTIGALALFEVRFAWFPLLLGFIGAGLLFSASIMLILESRIALELTYAEMDFVLKKHKRGVVTGLSPSHDGLKPVATPGRN
jgi:hypothetical protein